jgi:hypothetical protein
MFHTVDSERRQFQHLRAAAEREFARQPPRPQLVAATVAPNAETIPRPLLELRRNPMLPAKPSVLTPTATFHKKK